ncbi:S9 family peptidase [Bacteroidota bacterium]
MTGCTKEKVDHTKIEAPKAKQIVKELSEHGNKRIDKYYWLNERDNPAVIEYLNAENEYTKKVMAHTEDLQEILYNEIIGRIKKTDESVPYFYNEYYYYERYETGKEYPLQCRKKGSLDSQEEILFNESKMAEGKSYFSLRDFTISVDNKLAAYGTDTVGRRKYDIQIKNLKTGEIFPEIIPLTTGEAVWANDNKTIFYTLKDENTLRAYKIMRHVIGTDVSEDVTVYEELDDTFRCWVDKSKNDKYIFIYCLQTLTTETLFINADNPTDKFRSVQPRERGHEYNVETIGEQFYIVTNWNAKNFRLMKTKISQPGKENWVEVIPNRDKVLLIDIELFNDFLVINERKDGLGQLRIRTWDGTTDYYMKFDEAAYDVDVGENYDFDSDLLRFEYSSLVTPQCVFDINMKTKKKVLLKQDEIPGDYNPDDYVIERHFAEVKDGAKVPISLAYKNGLAKDGNNPLYLYGYGSYGYTIDPDFDVEIASLLDRGFIFAIAHIRGGDALGREWYEKGKLFNKKNTFTDFIDCTEYLIEEKFTNKKLIAVYGGSAGGLLIGAVVNMRPDLFKAAIGAVPFVDVVTTMLDDSIPLTTFEYDEWGNPNVKEYYDYMLSYSPYDQIEVKEYPAIMVTAGLHDSQVQYFEPAKWVAKLRELKTDDNLLILDCDMESGHGGASGRYKRYLRKAKIFAFVIDQLDQL